MRTHLCNFLSIFRGANLSAEDCNSFTPILTAAANKHRETFECLMDKVDLRSMTENPAFKVLVMPSYNSEIFKVRLLTVIW